MCILSILQYKNNLQQFNLNLETRELLSAEMLLVFPHNIKLQFS